MALDISEFGLLIDPFASVSRPRRRLSRATLRRRRLAKRNAVLRALAPDRLAPAWNCPGSLPRMALLRCWTAVPIGGYAGAPIPPVYKR